MIMIALEHGRFGKSRDRAGVETEPVPARGEH